MNELDSLHADVAEAFWIHAASVDAFVFRRVDGGRLVLLGGVGRARGWAGVVEIHLESEPLVHHAWTVRRPTQQSGRASTHVFGPYWAQSAVIVPLAPDELVVFGSPTRLRSLPHDVVEGLARRVAGVVAATSPATRLADELELLHAVRRATATADTDLQEAADHIVATAADALSCELGLLWVPAGDVLAVADLAAPPTLPLIDDRAGGLIPLMESLLARPDRLPRCQQDNRLHPLPAPLGVDSPVVAWLAVHIDGAAQGLMLLCHTVAKPRGFTLLCQEIGHRIAEAAATPLATALMHEQLRSALARASDEARRDPLTGVANRLGWQDALATLGGERRGAGAAIIMLDLDELKQVNDEHGHRAGDQMLRAVAGVLVSATRRRDTVARVGGDEFAVLLRNTDEASCLKVVRRIDDRIAALDRIGGRPVAASMGWASRPTNGSMDDVLQLADRRMYEAKRARTGR